MSHPPDFLANLAENIPGLDETLAHFVAKPGGSDKVQVLEQGLKANGDASALIQSYCKNNSTTYSNLLTSVERFWDHQHRDIGADAETDESSD